jgi:hypothetical protein
MAGRTAAEQLLERSKRNYKSANNDIKGNKDKIDIAKGIKKTLNRAPANPTSSSPRPEI